ncbi:DMT(drug/metabolite transporter) superfamily permease [Schinkia azotoformans MEV2011]|uniref:DMT(Drug/metabolite transporter) superfamily permease n=1 Tax=Schinkia azotoformans MEV2011 TaxID=1348973 RepID=A0A072NIL5_SCHAZ|nr:DMT family transporter [Schinkia azotoformans]KEF36723.1 DMT(drug/metabolite transporter) superfamily permease [Schinkia azotoformans MEV2011]MEC1696791.1 DMT family transporter [Schinkia azotoformans]MEC1727558.1 DMT family transporter [Schinkia azotoformans]MEC1772740.1 DMT family transporter [Schinkia azotoformans]MEC1782308.1 DMT family transporter [Schinkia azotoformans]
MEKLSTTKASLGIAFVVLIWGSIWPIYKFSLQFSPPLLYAGIRGVIGGILLTLFLLPWWRKIQWKKTWPIYLISAFFNVVIFNGIQMIGLQYLPSGLYTVIVYLQPVLVVLLTWLWLKETLSAKKAIGMLIGFLGVVIVSIEGISGKISTLGIILALITGLGWAIGTVYVRKTSTMVDNLWLVAIQNIIGGFIMFGAGMATEDFSAIQWNLPFFWSLLYGAIFAVILANAVYLKLMSVGEASKVGSYTFLVPMISVFIGIFMLGEPFTVSLFGGMILILFSIYLINSKKTRETTVELDVEYERTQTAVK